MKYDVWVGRNDRSKSWQGKWFADIGLLESLPEIAGDRKAQGIVELIDVIWLHGRIIQAAFEIEHTTAVYSGLLRMSDLLSLVPNLTIPLYVVAPERRRKLVVDEINRPTFREVLRLHEKCRLITFERLTTEIKKLEGYTTHLAESFLDKVSEPCELIDVPPGGVEIAGPPRRGRPRKAPQPAT